MVREKHGVLADVVEMNRADIYERGTGIIRLVVGDKVDAKGVNLNPDEADYLASKLRRLARRARDAMRPLADGKSVQT